GPATDGDYAIVSDGDGFLVVSVDIGVNTAPHVAHLMALTAAGQPRGGLIAVALPEQRSIGDWSVVWSGAAYILACTARDGSAWITAIGRSAEIVAPSIEMATAGAQEIALGTNGSSALAVWATRPAGVISDTPMTPGVMRAQLLDSAGGMRGSAF